MLICAEIISCEILNSCTRTAFSYFVYNVWWHCEWGSVAAGGRINVITKYNLSNIGQSVVSILYNLTFLIIYIIKMLEYLHMLKNNYFSNDTVMLLQ